MKKSITINYKGSELEIEGDYNKGFSGDRETPPDSPSFEIETVKLSGVDITNLLESIDNNIFSKLEELCFEEMDNDIIYNED